MKERALTCIVCPRGCPLTVTLGEGGEVLSVTGNAGKRGVEYATTECTPPHRHDYREMRVRRSYFG